MVHSQQGRGGGDIIETVPNEAQASDLLDNDFKSTISDIFKEPKETRSRELSYENYVSSVGEYH